MLIEMFDETDKQIEFFLLDEFKPWQDEIEGARQFLEDIKVKKIEQDIRLSRKGNTVIKTIKGENKREHQEIEYSAKTFNPFDQLNIKTQEGKISKVYIERDSLDQHSSDDQGLTLGTTPTEETTEEANSTSDGGVQQKRSKSKQK